MKKLTFFILLFHSSAIYALKSEATPESPWLTGPLLTPSGYTVSYKHFDFEPYIYVSKSSHTYDGEWKKQHSPTYVSLQTQYWVEYGLGKRWDFQIAPAFSWNHSKGQAQWVFNDLVFGFDYQLYLSDNWYPSIKLSLFEIFPTGKYQHLNAKKLRTDVGGVGSFQTELGITFTKLFYFGKHHWLNTRLDISYIYLSPVHVKGLNVYGGTSQTHGKEFPGNQFSQLIGLEYSLTHHWAFALDIVNFYANKNRFSGFAGSPLIPATALLPLPTSGSSSSAVQNGAVTPLAPIASANMKSPSQNQISLAPAIEYNFNGNMGIITGAWFTVAGRNSSDFFKWVIAFNLYR